MADLALPPVTDFGSVNSEKQQAIRLEFFAKAEETSTMVNIVCKTKKKATGEDDARVEDVRSTVPLDRLLSHVNSLNLKKTDILGIYVLETRTEWKQKIVFSLRKLFFLLCDLPIVQLEVGAVHWSIFSDLRMDFYATFKNLNELVFLPDQIPEPGDHNHEGKIQYHRTLLLEWLPRVKATLRCLRVFTFLRVCGELEEVVNKCIKLRTITIGKLHSYRDVPEFNLIQYLDLDGQMMAYSSDDLRMARKARMLFPAARVFRVVRHSIEMLKSLLQTVIVAGGVFDIYTDLYEITHLRHIVGDTLELELLEAHPEMEGAYVEVMGRNQRFRTTIHFYNHRVKRFID